MTIHWLGVGLSSVPGLKLLISRSRKVHVWNRTLDKAVKALGELAKDTRISPFDWDALALNVKESDIVVSMLPGDFHVPVAKICHQQRAHFVSSSYISPQMRQLDADAKSRGLVFMNEVGLDPGLDHLMAHHLVREYTAFRAEQFHAHAHEISFTSYCGGLGEKPNKFCYQFSWSPTGVLKALLSPSKSLRDGRERIVERPWHAVSDYLVNDETFEVYPNRDSLPFMADYHFADDWQVKNFVRGTLRYQGWSKAWGEIFDFMENLDRQENPDQALKDLSANLWQKYSFNEGEHDRVVLSVEMKAEEADKTVWHHRFLLDAVGDREATAMARLVSEPLALIIEAVMNKNLPAGVHSAPADAVLSRTIFDHIAPYCRVFSCQDLLE